MCVSAQTAARKLWQVYSNFTNDRRNTMPLIQLVIVLVVFGVLLWAVNTYIPMEGNIKKILNVVVILVVVLFVLSAFGLLGPMQQMRVG
jgi:hypothetical protein